MTTQRELEAIAAQTRNLCSVASRGLEHGPLAQSWARLAQGK